MFIVRIMYNLFTVLYIIPLVLSLNYQYDPRIHTFGNVGFSGAFHALISPTCTWAIDKFAYNGVDVRKLIINEYCKQPFINIGTLDLCSGTGYSSTDYGISVDTSMEMLTIGYIINNKNRHYVLADAETINIPHNIVTCMFALHEIPRNNRINLIINAIRNSNKRVVLVDIHESYIPSEYMLQGEPYLLDYLSNCKIDVISACTYMNKKFSYEIIIPGHVQAWIIE